jgi:uncharacterized protein (AIM24 family)
LLVQAGHVGIIDPTIEFNIQMVSGFRNILFGGHGRNDVRGRRRVQRFVRGLRRRRNTGNNDS